jgi:PhzF family phenazine biosynthesis protein
LNITKTHLIEGKTPLLVNTGNSFLIIPIRSQQILREIEPNLESIENISHKLNLIGYYAFSTETHKEQRDATARMFAPLYGIHEESATGMAAGPLACYFHDVLGIKKDTYYIEQGYLMHPPSPSLLIVELEKSADKITKIMAGGKGLVMQEKIIEIE